MFEPSAAPRLFGMPLGVDFPKALVDQLLAMHADQPPEHLARVHLIVNTRRMARRIRELFDAGPALLLPRISLLTDFGDAFGYAQIPGRTSSLQRRLELIKLIKALLDAEPEIAPRSALFDLSDSLAALMDEMQGEGVTPDDVATIETHDQSGHWERIKAFLGIVRPYFDTNASEPDVEARQRLIIEHFVKSWNADPPQHPIILAGSTGSRGATQLLMQAISRLPQGAVVLPGFDFDQPNEIWETLIADPSLEDHPQYRYADLLRKLGADRQLIQPWPNATPVDPDRCAVLSIALRPAPVTDQWLRDGPTLKDRLLGATEDITLLEAPSHRIEALTIAMRLRKAAEDGQTAALITPDRVLTRRVSSALERWGIIPDDSAGLPLHHSAPGRFLRHVADLFVSEVDCALFLTILKHPLCHASENRGAHLRYTRELELYLRRKGYPFPTEDAIRTWAAKDGSDEVSAWVDWVCANLLGQTRSGTLHLTEFVAHHLDCAQALSHGVSSLDTCPLWKGEAGQEALKTVSNLAEDAKFGDALGASDYRNLFYGVLSRETVRVANEPHPKILIWGTLEARVQGADLLILAGLNEGTWPEAPGHDPWLSRAMRRQAGLLLPERRIGLSAHDFQQAAAAKHVWLSRSVRSDDTETVPSRWLNRLQNLLCGLKAYGGQDAYDAMTQRGQKWLNWAHDLEKVEPEKPAPRPSPAPPVASRPRHLSVTDIDRLLRDPYAIYAKHILRLKPLDPLMRVPDARLRGTVLHKVLEQAVRESVAASSDLTAQRLEEISQEVLKSEVAWGEARLMWQARLQRVAKWFSETETVRRSQAEPTGLEVKGTYVLGDLGFSLTATADRIDLSPTGDALIYDYKTGQPPSKNQQLWLDKQLLLEALIAESAGYDGIPATKVTGATYIGLGSTPGPVPAPLDKITTEKLAQDLRTLVTAYLSEQQGFTAKRAAESTAWEGDYDHLARFGEWGLSDAANREAVE